MNDTTIVGQTLYFEPELRALTTADKARMRKFVGKHCTVKSTNSGKATIEFDDGSVLSGVEIAQLGPDFVNAER